MFHLKYFRSQHDSMRIVDGGKKALAHHPAEFEVTPRASAGIFGGCAQPDLRNALQTILRLDLLAGFRRKCIARCWCRIDDLGALGISSIVFVGSLSPMEPGLVDGVSLSPMESSSSFIVVGFFLSRVVCRRVIGFCRSPVLEGKSNSGFWIELTSQGRCYQVDINTHSV